MRSPALALSAAAAAILAATAWSHRPATPVGADAPETEFSAERAQPVVTTLVDEIGHRTAGTEGATRALEVLTATMRAIPGLEVEVQDAMHYAMGPYSGPSVFRARNVVARLRGESDEAILLAAHYDSATNSVGAADDAVGVAAVVETARALAAGPKLRRSVVFLLDETEELGLFGAQGFLHHRWADDVVTFLNLEAAGARGRPILFQTGPGDPWLARVYAEAAPHPHGSVMGQDVFQSGIIPSDTDFRVYRDQADLTGLDVALYRDGWAYHTHLDRSERLEPGSLQEMGANSLGVVRALANGDLPGGRSDMPAVYYDVFGVFMVAYPQGWGRVFALGALLLLAGALVLARRRTDVQAGDFVSGTWLALAGVLGGALLGPCLSVCLVGADLEAGWYARPWLAPLAYGLPAIFVACAAARLAVVCSRRTLDGALHGYLGGCGIVHGGFLVVATLGGAGSAYLPLWATLGTAAGLMLAQRTPRVAAVVAFVVPAVFVVPAADSLLSTFAAMSGRMRAPMDPVVAGIAALPIAGLALAPAAFIAAFPPHRGRRTLLAIGGVAALAVVALMSVSPYTAERPKRVGLQIRSTPESETHELFSMDSVPLDDPRAKVVNPLKGADPLDGLPPVEITRVRETDGPRRLHVRVDPRGATAVRLDFDPPVRALIVDDGRVELREEDRRAWITFVAPPAEGFDLVIETDGDGPQRVETVAIRRTFDAAFHERMRLLPEWTALDAHAYVHRDFDF